MFILLSILLFTNGPEVKIKYIRSINADFLSNPTPYGWGRITKDDKDWILIPDRQEHRISIIGHADGRLIRHIGVKGKGPGEFTWRQSPHVAVTSDSIWITNDRKLVRFSHDLEYQDEMTIPYFSEYLAVLDSGEKILRDSHYDQSSGMIDDRVRLLQAGTEFVEVDLLHQTFNPNRVWVKDQQRFRWRPWGPIGIVGRFPDGRLYVTDCHEKTLKVFRPDGRKVVGQIQVPLPARAPDEEEVAATKAYYQDWFQGKQAPEIIVEDQLRMNWVMPLDDTRVLIGRKVAARIGGYLVGLDGQKIGHFQFELKDEGRLQRIGSTWIHVYQDSEEWKLDEVLLSLDPHGLP